MTSAKSLTDRFHTWDVVEDVHINKNQSMSIVYQLVGVDSVNKSVEEMEGLSQNINSLYNALPDHTEIQWYFDNYYDRNTIDSEIKSDDENLRYLADKRKEHIESQLFLKKELFIVITFNHQITNYKKKQPLFSYFLSPPEKGKQKEKQKSSDRFYEDLSEIESFARLIPKYLGQLKPLRLDNNAIICFLKNYYNMTYGFKNEAYVSTEQFNHNLLNHAYATDKTGMSIGHDYLSVISMSDLPTYVVDPVEFDNGEIKSPLYFLLDLPYEMRVVAHFQKLKSDKMLSPLNLATKFYGNMSKYSSVAAMKYEELAGSEEYEGIVNSLELNKDILMNMSINVFSLHNNKNNLKSFEDDILKSFGDFYDAKAIVENKDALPIFLGSAPGNYQNHYRYLMIRGSSAASFVNLTAHNPGMSSGFSIFNRDGKVIKYDFFNSNTNYNVILTAPSGSGKSFTVNSIISQYLQEAVKTVILDVGGSYRPQVEAYNGQYIEIDSQHPSNIDPFKYFTFGKNGQYSEAQSIDFIQSVIELMLLKSDVAQVDLPKDQKGVLLKSIKKYFNDYSSDTPNINEYYEFIKEDPEFFDNDESMRNYCVLSLEYFLDRYNQFFNASNQKSLSFDPNQSLICFDLIGVENLKDLLPIYAYLITITVDAINKKDKNKFIFVLDEAWKFLQESESISRYTELALRTFRKMNGSIIIITQDIRDLTKGPLEKAISSANTKILLHHDKDHDVVRDALNLNDNEYRAFQNLNFDERREILFCSNQEALIATLAFSEHDYIMYTTEPNEIARRQQLVIENNGDIIKAVESLVEQKTKG